MKNIKIGITAYIKDSIFSNGLNQNALFLAMILKDCGYSVDIICSTEKTKSELLNYTQDIDCLLISESFNNHYHLVIQLGLTVDIIYAERWKKVNPDVKFVDYECGNQFIISMEKMIFNHDLDESLFTHHTTTKNIPDQVWSIPQMEKTNVAIYEHLSRQKNVTVVPFVWNPAVIEKSFILRHELKKSDTIYKPREIRRCSIMEPNTSVMKNCFLPLVFLEKNQKINKLQEIYIFGAQKIKNSKPFMDFVKNLNIFKSKILSAEDRYITSKILTDHTDFVLSWQWENNLNYLWFDVAWMGWPVVHNGSMCKDVGYYYEGFDSDQALDKIDEVIKTHNNNYLEYIQRNRNIISRYTQSNKEMMNNYKELVENVISGKFKKYIYDEKTNTIK